MSNVSSQFSPAGMYSRQNALSDAQFAGYVKQKSVTAHESIDAGLTIQTKEGDLVTLTSNSFSQMDAYMYNSKGLIKTDSGTALFKQNQREITLTSGETFSFSVVGDLSDDELEDIEAIVKGIDEIISEMADGDMTAAIGTALTMGGYDTVSSYAADITYERSYAMTSEVAAAKGDIPEIEEDDHGDEDSEQIVATPADPLLAEDEVPNPSAIEPFPENRRPWRKRDHSIKKMDQFIEKMAEKLESHDTKEVGLAQEPVDKLFNHHMKKLKDDDDSQPAYNAIKEARERISSMIKEMLEGLFEGHLASLMDDQ